MRRLVVTGLLACALGAGVTTPATAHTLPISYAKNKAQKIIKKHFRAYPWSFITVQAEASNCERLSAHKVRCRAFAVGDDGSEGFSCRGWVSVRFVFPDSYITTGAVKRERCFPI